MIKPYKNVGGNSGIMAYEAGEDFIRIIFYDGYTYEYTHAVSGVEHVEEMKRLAADGKGLGTYINQHVKEKFASKK